MLGYATDHVIVILRVSRMRGYVPCHEDRDLQNGLQCT